MISGSILDVRRDRGILIDANDLNSTLVHQVDPSHAQPLKIGSSITVNDHEAIVTGIFERSREFFWEPVIYTTYSRAVQFSLPERRSLSYVLVKLQNPADAIHIQKVIHETTGLRVMTSDEFGSFTMWFILLQTGILINFGITIALGIVIGALVAGQLFYTFILDNLRHYAALKAMGVTNSAMKRFVMVQVLFVGAVGYGIGLGMASIVGFFAAGGSLAFRMTWHVPLVSLAAIGMCCILASRVSLYRVFNTETAVVFK
jgi:putative ABC transport system permease protein